MSEIFQMISFSAFLVFSPLVFLFIVVLSAYKAACSGLKPKTIVFKALAALAIWFAVSCAMFYILILTLPEPEEFRRGTFLERYGGYVAFAALVIYILVGIGLGFWIKGRTRWRTSAQLQ